MAMEAITMEIGLRAKWKALENFMMQMEIYNMKGNGNQIIIMGKAHSMV